MFDSFFSKYTFQVLHQLISSKKLDRVLYKKYESMLRSVMGEGTKFSGFYTLSDLTSKVKNYKVFYNNINDYIDKGLLYALFTSEHISWDDDLLMKYEKEIFKKIESGLLNKATNINWTKSLVQKYFLELNFDQLYKNHSFIWTDEIIEIFTDESKNHISVTNNRWKCLLSNDSNVVWNDRLIKKYQDKICFKTLSANHSVNWTFSFIDKHLDDWDWVNLSGNPSLPLNLTFLLRYESKLNWIQGREYSSISSNPGVIWTLDLFEIFVDKIDVFYISKYATIDERIILKYTELFNIVRSIGYQNHSFSDWQDYHEIFSTPWEAVAKNPNFKFSFQLICHLSKFKSIKKYFLGDARIGFTEYEKTVDTLEYIQQCTIKELDVANVVKSHYLHFFINSSKKQVFYKDSRLNKFVYEPFINESIWRLINAYFDDYNKLSEFLEKAQLSSE